VNINLSYWVFPALYAFQDFQPKEPLWGELITSGLRLIEYARFGAWQMPPDWLMVRKNDLKLAKGFPRRFGLDAVRIPLYLIWAGHKQHWQCSGLTISGKFFQLMGHTQIGYRWMIRLYIYRNLWVVLKRLHSLHVRLHSRKQQLKMFQ